MAEEPQNINDILGPEGLDAPNPETVYGKEKSLDDDEIVETLVGYRMEAEDARRTGYNPRDAKWQENLDLYWNRYDFSNKAGWQARETMPEVPAFVDRFAAAMKDALIASPTGFYTIQDPGDRGGDLSGAVKKMTDIWLERCGMNYTGIPLGFPAVFEEQMKIGALMNPCAQVCWRNDVPHGRVAVENADPQMVWLDATGRGLYRVHREYKDRHVLTDMAREKDPYGKPFWNLSGVQGLVSSMMAEDAQRAAARTGDGGVQAFFGQGASRRQTVCLDEYYVKAILDSEGKVAYRNALCVVANDRYLVRGPEPNPYMHGEDWLVTTPLVSAPLSVYGRTYMEDFGSLARTFNDLTNMLIDIIHTAGMNAFAVVPEMLINPSQIASGIGPNKTFLLEGGNDPRQFAEKLELGSLDPQAFQLWQAVKNELREASSMNEIGLGGFAPKSRTSATEIGASMQSSSAILRSMAQSVEERWLNLILDRVWKTGLQKASPNDPILNAAVGNPALVQELFARRDELISRPLYFRARGISWLIQKASTLQKLIQLLQIIASNELLLKEFLNVVSLEKLVKRLFELSDVDLSTISMDERERQMKQVMEQLQAAQEKANGTAGEASPSGKKEVASAARSLGV